MIAMGGSILIVNIQKAIFSLPLNLNLLRANPARDPMTTETVAELTETTREFNNGGIMSTAIPPIPTKLVTTFRKITLKLSNVGGEGKKTGG